jgi:hypothetical protein
MKHAKSKDCLDKHQEQPIHSAAMPWHLTDAAVQKQQSKCRSNGWNEPSNTFSALDKTPCELTARGRC